MEVKEILIGNNLLFGIVSSFTFFVANLYSDMKLLHIILGLILYIVVQVGFSYVMIQNPNIIESVYKKANEMYKYLQPTVV